MTIPEARIRLANARSFNPSGRYVLYWMQAFRRLRCNHALDHALRLSADLKAPLVVYEGLKLYYPWASHRHHAFLLEGMTDNAATAKQLGLTYWPFVETPQKSGYGLLCKLAIEACAVVSDDSPGFIVPAQNRALAGAIDVAFHLVDGNSVVPLSLLGGAVSAAAHLRPRIHRLFAEAWKLRANVEPQVPEIARSHLDPPFEPWEPTQDIRSFLTSLPLDASVPPVPGIAGGVVAAQTTLADFTEDKLARYSEGRNNPDDPARTAASRLSPYLRHGHLGIEEVIASALGDWSPDEINVRANAKRDDFFCRDPNVNSFLDEAITWRDVGYHWHWVRNVEHGAEAARRFSSVSRSESVVPSFNFESMDFSPGGERTLEVALPAWAKATLRKHEADPRAFTYTLEEFEAGATHDDLWNAAQQELVATGRIHNYLRMLWGKKVMEWSATPAEAYGVLEHLNNKYAIDGRDPNSYTGILWCFGLFDRPWAPERKVFGSVRFMSSDNTAKKFKLAGYYEYIRRLPTIAEVRQGRTAFKKVGLFE